MAAPGQRDVAGDARREHDTRLGGRPGERLRRVAHDVQHRLHELLGVGLDVRERDVEVGVDGDCRELGLHHALTRTRISWMLVRR